MIVLWYSWYVFEAQTRSELARHIHVRLQATHFLQIQQLIRVFILQNIDPDPKSPPTPRNAFFSNKNLHVEESLKHLHVLLKNLTSNKNTPSGLSPDFRPAIPDFQSKYRGNQVQIPHFNIACSTKTFRNCGMLILPPINGSLPNLRRKSICRGDHRKHNLSRIPLRITLWWCCELRV